MNKTWILFGLSALFICVVLYSRISGVAGNAHDSERTSRAIQVRGSFEISNENQHVLDGLSGWFSMPLNIPERQQLIFKPAGVVSAYQVEGVDANVQFDFDIIAPFSRKRIDYSYSVDIFNAPQRQVHVADFEPYLSSNELIETSNQKVRVLARQLEGDSILQSARMTFEWVRRNIKSVSYRAEPASASFVLERGLGDCTDQAILSAALLRALNIPARIVTGYYIERTPVKLDSSMYHDWVEFYVDKKWVLSDSQKGNFDKNYDRYVVYRLSAASYQVSPRFGIHQQHNVAMKML